jgi:hypothetical protein
VASGSLVGASDGVFASFASVLPPYVQARLDSVIDFASRSSTHLSTLTGLPETAVASTFVSVLLAIIAVMSRYGWSSRPQLSPYSSNLDGPPHVTDEDYSYITSQDLHDADTFSSSGPEDDVLFIKSKGTQFDARFPAYSIGDGKLHVRDVRDRVGLMLELSDRRTRVQGATA